MQSTLERQVEAPCDAAQGEACRQVEIAACAWKERCNGAGSPLARHLGSATESRGWPISADAGIGDRLLHPLRVRPIIIDQMEVGDFGRP